MKTRHFRDLVVWQESMALARDIYSSTESFPKQETFGLTAQIRRAAVSVPSNIAEGHGRSSDKSFALFVSQARGSLFELETQLELASGLAYIRPVHATELIDRCEQIARKLNALLKALKEKEEVPLS
jgi:four helix bundle protein